MALCRLSWLAGGRGGDRADNTLRVVAPALGTLLGRSLSSETHEELQTELSSTSAPARIRALLTQPVGFTNFYSAYRNQSPIWMRQNSSHVIPILKRARRLRTDAEARQVYAAIQNLAPIPIHGKKLAAASLLTPVVACLDPRARSPIINGRAAVKARLRRLGLAHRDLVTQFTGLSGLIHQGGFVDAFALDVDESDVSLRPPLMPRVPLRRHRRPGPISRPLREKDIREVRILLRVQSHSYRRLHNEMTNALKRLLDEAGLVYDEGRRQSCLYDARVTNYDRTGRDLLIEAKAAIDMPFCRMAVGQLLDYRRQLPTRARTDLGALFPRSPSKSAIAFMGGVGAKVLWFDPSLKKIGGDWAP